MKLTSEMVGGGEGVRTLDPQLAKLVLSQLSYAPIFWKEIGTLLLSISPWSSSTS